MTVDLKPLMEISLAAGKKILDIYEKDIEVEWKADESPLTEADRSSHDIIMERLQETYPDLPILSEEGADIPYEERKSWNKFFLVDPLDGTKEFIKRNGEFTVNIALIEGNYPTMGMIYAPALDILYFGREDVGAFKMPQASAARIEREEDILTQSEQLPSERHPDMVHVVASRSHMSEETEEFIDNLKSEHHSPVEVVSAGSSLKFCLVAEGKADYYPRYAPTMEWDTGAGQAIVEASGGTVLHHDNDDRFSYNQEQLTNGWFLARNH